MASMKKYAHGVCFIDLKSGVEPNAIETLTNERIANVRDAREGLGREGVWYNRRYARKRRVSRLSGANLAKNEQAKIKFIFKKGES
jgi:hypothetical protein